MLSARRHLAGRVPAAARAAAVGVRVSAAPRALVARPAFAASQIRSMAAPAWSKHPDQFERRHNGPSAAAELEMLKTCNAATIDVLMDETVPPSIRNRPAMKIGEGLSETEALEKLYNQVKKNKMYKTFIGMGYYNTITPPAILRNVIQNPGWYTPYTPYQAEMSQGRMESLVNYQTMIADLTGMPMAQSSLLVSTPPVKTPSLCI